MRYVVIGSSAAGVNAVKELRRLDASAEIVLVSKDKDIYSRCILHHYLGGERTKDELCFVELDFEQRYNIIWKKGLACVGLNREAKTIQLENGEDVAYDKLLIATGSHTFIPPVENLKEAGNVIGFRNIDDIESMKANAKDKKHIVILGAGLVGMDCASGFLDLGKTSTIIDLSQWPLARQLDKKSAQLYIDELERRGVKQYYGVGLQKVLLDDAGNISGVVFGDGEELPCDYLIVTAGVRSNVEFLTDTGIELSRFGLVYDETGKTNDDDIYGAGDVSGLRPIWPVAVKEGIIAASNMAGVPQKMTNFFASKSTMNFFGIPTMSLGRPEPEEGEVVEIDERNGNYRKIIHKDGKIVGAILQGDLAYSGILQQLIANKIDISKVKKSVFDIDYSDFFHVDKNFEYFYEGE